jgi:hypothetical protein
MAGLHPTHGWKPVIFGRALDNSGTPAYVSFTVATRPGQIGDDNMRKTISPQPMMQAPDAPAGSDSGDTETVKRAVAKHELLDAGGAVVEEEELATGIRYTLLANSQAFDYQSGMEPGKRETLLVVFGAKTLATNETSALRNSTKGSATPDEQMDAVRERFALLETGKWVDRTREGVGAKIDLDALANAICNVMVAEGKYTAEDVTNSKLAATRAKLDDDKAFARKARQHPPFAAEYAKIKGAAAVSTDDFAL